MEAIIEKLKRVGTESNDAEAWKDWSLEEIQNLLQLYSIISKQEEYIFDLIYDYHGCDSWEDIFRDYNSQYLHDKARGVEIALETIRDRLKK